MEDYKFIEVCNNSESMRDASIKLNMSFSTFKRKALKLGCYKTNQFWSRGKTRISDSRILSKYNKEDIFVEDSKVKRDQIKNIIIKENLIEYICSDCGNDGMWNNKVINLQLDHINGVRNDNRLENLRFLCPNCHSQTATYRNKNKKRLSDERITRKFNKSKTFNDLCIRLGVSNRGSAKMSSLRKRLNALGLFF